MNFINENINLKKMIINEIIFFDAEKSDFRFFLFDIYSFIIKKQFSFAV